VLPRIQGGSTLHVDENTVCAGAECEPVAVRTRSKAKTPSQTMASTSGACPAAGLDAAHVQAQEAQPAQEAQAAQESQEAEEAHAAQPSTRGDHALQSLLRKCGQGLFAGLDLECPLADAPAPEYSPSVSQQTRTESTVSSVPFHWMLLPWPDTPSPGVSSAPPPTLAGGQEATAESTARA
jgi:hypothetical protein